MPIPNFVAGWISDPARVQESIQAREERGQAVMGANFVATNTPQLAGSWKRFVASGGTGVFLRDREKHLLGGHYRRPYFQKAGTCHPSRTRIAMADKSTKNIEDVKIGDEVLSHNFEARKVLDVGSRDYGGILVTLALRHSDQRTRLTADHPVAVFGSEDGGGVRILTRLQWVSAMRMMPLYRVLGSWGKMATVDSVEKRSFEGKVYSLEVEEEHSYFADGIAVHNCVSRGMTRAAQVSLDVSIVDNVSLQKPVELTFAPVYSMARHEIGKDRCGYGDGAILADAAEAIHELGIAVLSDLFPGLTEVQVEQLAVKYAAPGVGTPKAWMQAAAGHTAVTFFPDSLDLIFDCLTQGYAVAYANGYITGQPNAKGISGPGSAGGHCRFFSGVFLDENGDTQLESSESWGEFPAGNPSDADYTMSIDRMPTIQLHYAGGVKSLCPGCVGVNAKQFWNLIQSGGEAWAVGPAKFDADSFSDITSQLGS